MYSRKTANATREGGNDIYVSQNSHRRFTIRIKNDKGDVEITHTTALNLVNALINNNEAEYYIYNVIKDKLEWKELAYPNLWKNNLGGIQ